MKKLIFLSVIIFVFNISKFACAQIYSGNDLWNLCRNSVTYNYPGYSITTFPNHPKECEAYISSVIDTISFMIETLKKSSQIDVCFWNNILFSKEILIDQLKDLTLQYLNNHPEERHLNGAILIVNALSTAFPCSD